MRVSLCLFDPTSAATTRLARVTRALPFAGLASLAIACSGDPGSSGRGGFQDAGDSAGSWDSPPADTSPDAAGGEDAGDSWEADAIDDSSDEADDEDAVADAEVSADGEVDSSSGDATPDEGPDATGDVEDGDAAIDADGSAEDAGDDSDAAPPDPEELPIPTPIDSLCAEGSCCNLGMPYPNAECVNVALGATVSVTNTYMDGFPGQFAAANAVDGEIVCNSWNAGAYAPQSITIDFGVERTISGLVVVPESVPETVSGTHEFQFSDDGVTFITHARLTSELTRAKYQVLAFSSPATGRYLRVLTTSSPSWVAWRDIGAFECP